MYWIVVEYGGPGMPLDRFRMYINRNNIMYNYVEELNSGELPPGCVGRSILFYIEVTLYVIQCFCRQVSESGPYTTASTQIFIYTFKNVSQINIYFNDLLVEISV